MAHTAPSSSAFRRRGSAYIVVIGISLLCTVMAMATLTSVRLNNATASSDTDWEEAGVLAQTAVEHALSYLTTLQNANPTTWRNSITNYVHGSTPVFTASMGRGTWYWGVCDPVNSTFSTDYQAPFKIYGIGKVNRTTRCYSVKVAMGGAPLDFLRCGLHAGGALTGGGQAIVSNTTNPLATDAYGTISTNGKFTGAGGLDIYANLEATSLAPGNNGTFSGTSNGAAAVKTMPSPALYNLYLSQATTVPWSSITGGNIQKCLISPTSTPAGVTNPNGVYSIAVSSGANLTITQCRIVGTLIISMTGGNLQITGPVQWQPARPDYPSLILSGSNVNVQFQGSTSWLSESTVGVDLNGNGTTTDDFCPYYRGLFHIAGASNTVQVSNDAYFWGTLVADGAVTTNNVCAFVSDPNLYYHPPIGYGTGSQMLAVPGSWLWDSPP